MDQLEEAMNGDYGGKQEPATNQNWDEEDAHRPIRGPGGANSRGGRRRRKHVREEYPEETA